MRKITQAIGAGETVYLPMCKSFMLIETADYDCSFYFYGKNNQLNKEIANFKDIFTVNAGENEFFMKVGVFSASAQSIDVVLLDDDRVLYNKMAGSVSVTSSASSPIFVRQMDADYLSINKQSFILSCKAGATVNNITQIFLYNYAGSASNVMLTGVDISADFTTEISFNSWSSGSIPGTGIGAGINMFVGEATSQGEVGYSYGTTVPSGSSINNGNCSATAVSNNSRDISRIRYDRPYVFPPGSGASYTTMTKNCGLNCCFHWYEILN